MLSQCFTTFDSVKKKMPTFTAFREVMPLDVQLELVNYMSCHLNVIFPLDPIAPGGAGKRFTVLMTSFGEGGKGKTYSHLSKQIKRDSSL
nr:hypothetical protein BgiMline_021827 [Biomphalaria glabrata]